MKKSLRIASILLALVLVTSCFVGGTFAKYITTDDVADSARVAKFGVEVTAEGALFADTYVDVAGGNTPADAGELTVDSDNGDNVVAPGTNNDDNTFKFSITGTPEVDVKIDVVVEDTAEDVMLAGGFYDDVTTGDADIATVGADYYPIQYTLKHTADGAAEETLVDAKPLSELVAALEALTEERVAANTTLEETYGDYEISWKWAFGDAEGITGKDVEDTILGDLAANAPTVTKYNAADATVGEGAALVDGTDYNLDTVLDFSITVTQID